MINKDTILEATLAARSKDEQTTQELFKEHPELIGYLCVLTDKEAPEQLSIEAQKALIGFFENRIRKLEQQVTNLAALIADK